MSGRDTWVRIKNRVKAGILTLYDRKCTAVFSTLPLLLGFGRPMLEGIQHIVLKQLLIGDTHLHRLPGRTVFPIPG